MINMNCSIFNIQDRQFGLNHKKIGGWKSLYHYVVSKISLSLSLSLSLLVNSEVDVAVIYSHVQSTPQQSSNMRIKKRWLANVGMMMTTLIIDKRSKGTIIDKRPRWLTNFPKERQWQASIKKKEFTKRFNIADSMK